jgi:NAD(P)-dependent dehydrogenase (short-subunit alcohol dehydrogenase family)
MRNGGARRIVNISSIGGKVAVPHLLPYSASKFALTGFSEGLRAELAREFQLARAAPRARSLKHAGMATPSSSSHRLPELR